jgi:uncharacterized membrane protein
MQVGRLSYFLILISVALWCGMIFLTPALAGLGYFESSKLSYTLYSNICHQIATRSFFLYQYPLAVCHRCTGAHIGFLVGTLLYPIFYRLDKKNLPGRALIIVAAAVPGLDIILSVLGLWQNTATSRVLSGFVFGIAIPFYFIPGIVDLRCKVKQVGIKKLARQIL